LFVMALAAAGCHTGTRKTLVPDVPANGDPQARDRFLEAKAKFLEDSRTSAAEFERIATEYPNDPIVPWADLYAGIASVKSHDYAKADAALAKVLAVKTNEGVETKAKLYMGIAKNYEGDAAAARGLLAGTDRAIENDDERAEYLAAVAYALAAGDHPLAALPYFDQLWPRATATERGVMIGRIAAIVQAAAPDALAKAYDELADRKGPSIAIAGGRLALVADAMGDAAGAAKRRADIAPARDAAGLTRSITETTAGAVAKAPAGAGDPSLLGAVVPLGSKRDNLVAEATVAGLGLAAGATDGKGVAAIETRAAVDKDAAVAAVESLAGQNVIAIVGPIEGASVDAAAARVDGLGVPLISLSTTAEQRTAGRYVFHIRHSAEARARTLAKLAYAKGVTKFAVFAPDNGYGKAVGAAFAEAVEKAGGSVVKRVTYPKDTKSFAKQAKELGTSDWQAVFVPDNADVLALAVPAIAAAGNVPKPMPFPKKVLGGRPILLLSTAEGLNAAFVTSAGHNADGALLAPGFYPDDADPAAKPFLDRFVAAYGHAPGASEAYAYDAAELVAAATGGSRSALASQLAQSSLAGVTGTIKFDGDHRRSDPGLVYTVVEETAGTWAIRVK
jgi:ABC-type branched-subunit amino acid transport system substrate-binding protein